MKCFDATSWFNRLVLLSGEGRSWLELQGRVLHGLPLMGEAFTTMRDSQLAPSQKLLGFKILNPSKEDRPTHACCFEMSVSLPDGGLTASR